MRVAMVTHFPKSPGAVRGGVEGVAECLADTFSQRADIELSVIAPGDAQHPKVERRGRYDIYWISPSRLPGILSYWTTFRRQAFKAIRQIAPDIVHFQGLAGWTIGCTYPFVLTIHGVPELEIAYSHRRLRKLREWLVRAVERRGRRSSPNIIVINRYLTRLLSKDLAGQKWAISNPVHRDFFAVEPNPIASNVLYAGRISRRKNILGLIQVFAKVKSNFPDAVLRVVGEAEDGAYLDACKQLASQLGISGAVCFPGRATRGVLLDELAKASCVVLASHQETAPLILSEAMAAGVPIVSTDVCGIPHMLENERQGFTFTPGDLTAFAQGVSTMLADHSLAKRFSESARTRALGEVHPDQVVRQTINVYEEVIAQARSQIRSGHA